MTTGLCLFCNSEEKNCKTDPGTDFICSGCVILLAGVDQSDLKKAFIKAEETGLTNKASALQSFIIEDEYNVRKTKKSKRNMERERPLRKAGSARHKERA